MADRSDERSIHVSLILTLNTLSSTKALDSKQYMADISDNEDFNSQDFKLPVNNADGDNERSSRTLTGIESFVYLFYPYGDDIPVKAVFTKPDNTTFELKLNGATLISDAFDSITLINMSTDNSVVIRAIYS